MQFEPLDPAAAEPRLFEGAFDPPTHVRSISLASRYADVPDKNESDAACAALPEDGFFDAPDKFSALQAVDAFKLFRAASADAGSRTQFACKDLPDTRRCKTGWQTDIARFHDVVSIQDETEATGASTRTLVLSPQPRDGENSDELWLTLRFGGDGETLAKAQYVVQFPPPVP